jgi:hypothetical protein
MARFGESKCAYCKRKGAPIWEGRRDINGTRIQAHVHVRDDPYMQGIVHYDDGLGAPWHVVVETDEHGLMRPQDGHFIAHAPDDIAYLLAEITRLESLISAPRETE